MTNKLNIAKTGYSAWVAIALAILFAGIRAANPPKHIISYDVFGYYLYLPALFIHQDPAIKDISWVEKANEKVSASPSLYQLARAGNGNTVIRFFAGIAIMDAPFFLAGHAAALVSEAEADGFSVPYSRALIISGIFYSLLGVYFMRKLLLRFFSDKVSAIALFFLFIGSNVFFFNTFGNASPHIYLFSLYTLILYFTVLWHEKPKKAYALLLGLLTGLAVTCRPSEAVVALIPAFYGISGWKLLKHKLSWAWQERWQVILLITAFFLALLPQVLYWKFVTGSFFYWSYDDPQSGFDFLHPKVGSILFGFRKGMYVYSPMLLFATIGFWWLWKNKKEWFLPVVLFFAANVYIIASYSSLISYGWRAFIQSHAVMAIPLACLVSSITGWNRWVRMAAWIMLSLVVFLNLFKTLQTVNGVIDGSRMTKAYYFRTFFKAWAGEEDRKLLLVFRSDETRESFTDESGYSKKLLWEESFEKGQSGGVGARDSGLAYMGAGAFRLDSTAVYSPGLKIPYREITGKDHAWLRVSAWVRPSDPSHFEKVRLVVAFRYGGKYYKYRAFSLKDLGRTGSLNEWHELAFDYLTPEVRTGGDLLEFYVWYQGKSPVLVDEMKIIAYEPGAGR